jgi:hypothetical protein
LVIWILGKYVVRRGGGWNWLQIVSNGRLFGISGVEPSGSATREFVNDLG